MHDFISAGAQPPALFLFAVSLLRSPLLRSIRPPIEHLTDGEIPTPPYHFAGREIERWIVAPTPPRDRADIAAPLAEFRCWRPLVLVGWRIKQTSACRGFRQANRFRLGLSFVRWHVRL
jgi:hypothetical protein